MSAQRLYTPELLALAVELAQWPPLADARRGEARSPTCGSTLRVDLALDHEGRIERLGLQVRACAVGQAAAALFARDAVGRDATELGAALRGLQGWLAGATAMPEWPGLAMIEPARAYSARHEAILLPWKAALAALSSPARAG